MNPGSFERDCAATAVALGVSSQEWVQGAQNLVALDTDTVLRFPVYQRDADRIEEIVDRYRLARAFGLGAPEVLDYAGGAAGRAYVRLRRAPGLPLTEALAGLRPPMVPGCLQEVADRLVALRTVAPASWRYPGQDWRELWRDLPIRLSRHADSLPADRLPEWTEAARRAASVAGSAPLSLVHGDFQDQNIRVDGTGRISAVLDWDTAVVGDPAMDTAAVLHSVGPDLAGRLRDKCPWIGADMERFAAYAACWPLLHALWQAGDDHWLFTADQPEQATPPGGTER